MANQIASTAQPTKRKLGRGLGSLLSSPVQVSPPPVVQPPPAPTTVAPTPAAPPSQAMPDGEPGLHVQWLALEQIQPNPRQPRQQFDEQALEALANSIAASGLMQPIVVRARKQGGFELIAGERRWRAAKIAGLATIPAIVRDVDDRTSAELSLVENLQREDLNPIDRAEAFARLIQEFHLTHQEVAERVGLDRSSVTNHLRLNDLDEPAKAAVRSGQLTMGHAKALLAITNLQQRAELAAQALRQSWSVRELERRAKREANVDRPPMAEDLRGSAARRHMNELQRRLGEHLGTKVRIEPGRTKGSGTLIIEFYDLDQFEGLMRRLQFETE